jgi:ribonuclease HII
MIASGKKRHIAGVDEVGRGPLAGPVVAAAVILDPDQPISGLKDSKKLSPRKRLSLSLEIQEKALCYAIAQASEKEIDHYNILQASLLAMSRSVLALTIVPQHIQIDGSYIPDFLDSLPATKEAVIGGDAHIPAISAASIIAKVYRDQLMEEYDKVYPQYGFKSHKGYPTPIHLKNLALYGPCPIHRLSFKPVYLIQSSHKANIVL